MSYQAEHEHELEHVVVYVARSGDSGSPTLEVVGQWPKSEKILQPVETDTALRTPSSNRRWYPLQEGSILLGVIRAERTPTEDEWPESLDQLENSSTHVEQNLKSDLNIALNSLCNHRQGERSIQKLDKFEKSIKILIKILENYLGGYLKIDSKVSTLSAF